MKRGPGKSSTAVRAFACGLVSLAVAAGCQQQRQVENVYGQRGGAGALSVNGTRVLAGLFEQAGCRVSSWRRLSPKLDRDQVIVWAPDRFGAPRTEEVEYFERWLTQKPNRTLIFIGRDYDAAIVYWDRAVARSRGGERLRSRRQWARAVSAHAARLHEASDREDCVWFSLTPQRPIQHVTQVTGPLVTGGGTLTVDLPSSSELKPASERPGDDWEASLTSEVLLASDRRVLAARLTRPHWPDSQVIVVADGSWLLNLPQVDRANRQLAANLVHTCLPADNVCFLESGIDDLRIHESDTEPPLMLRMFMIWPVSVFMFHLVLAGLIFCFYVWPIFGRPRTLPEDRLSDFGKHITAVGDLLERGRDYAHASAQIRQFQELAAAKSSAASAPGCPATIGKRRQ